MSRIEEEVFEAEANRYYNDAVIAEKDGDITEANRYYKLAEQYLQDAKISYTGTGKFLSWNFKEGL